MVSPLSLTVELGARAYPIHIGAGLLRDATWLGALLPARKVAIVTNTPIALRDAMKMVEENKKKLEAEHAAALAKAKAQVGEQAGPGQGRGNAGSGVGRERNAPGSCVRSGRRRPRPS